MATANGAFACLYRVGLKSLLPVRRGSRVERGYRSYNPSVRRALFLVRQRRPNSTAPVDNGHSTAPLKKSAAVQPQPRPKQLSAGNSVSLERERGAGKPHFPPIVQSKAEYSKQFLFGGARPVLERSERQAELGLILFFPILLKPSFE